MKKILFLTMVCLMVAFKPCAHAISFVEHYSYDAGEADSKLSCRSISLLQVKRILVERLGTYLESNTVVTDHQITKDEPDWHSLPGTYLNLYPRRSRHQ